MPRPIRLSAAVMAHPERAFHVEQLVERLDRPTEVVWDRFNDKHDTGTRAMTAYDSTATHHLVVQDDALVCADLLAGVERALRYVPEGCPLSLYVGAVRPFARAVRAADAAHAHDPASFLIMPELNWGVAVVLPTHLIDELFDWYPSGRLNGYDARMGQWFRQRGIDCWYTWPSLVDHRDGPSLVGHGQRRHAQSFVGEHTSALDVDWTRRVLRINTTRDSAVQPPRRRPRRQP